VQAKLNNAKTKISLSGPGIIRYLYGQFSGMLYSMLKIKNATSERGVDRSAKHRFSYEEARI
jgi:hypothetical protein